VEKPSCIFKNFDCSSDLTEAESMNLGDLDTVTRRFENRMSAISEHWLAGVDG